MSDEVESFPCYAHPTSHTRLRCNRCDKPICAKCAKQTSVGFRCPDCLLSIQATYYKNQTGGYLSPFDGPFTAPLVTFLLLAAILIVYTAMELAGGSTESEVLIAYGATYGELLMAGQWWRLFTAMFLHIGLMHLGFNFIALVAFGIPMERLYGRGRFLLIYLLAGLFGNLASWAVRGWMEFSAGASGAIFGVLGMELALLWLYRRTLLGGGQERRTQLLIIIGVTLVAGETVMPANNVAHLGGLVAGAVLGYVLAPRPLLDRSRTPHRLVDHGGLLHRWWAIGVALLLFVGGTWLVQGYRASLDEAIWGASLGTPWDSFAAGGECLAWPEPDGMSERFERADPSEAMGTSRVLGRYELLGCDADEEAWARQFSPGDFVCRLWTLYGPPDEVRFEGFSYTFRDSESGLLFTAYAAGSGPAYGGRYEQHEALEPVILDFEALLASTEPEDCEIEYGTDYGRYRSGTRDGIFFDEPVE